MVTVPGSVPLTFTSQRRRHTPILMAFDCPYRDWRDLRQQPLGERRLCLERVVAGELVLPVRRLPADGAEAWAEVQRRGYEGLVAKNESAPYRSDDVRRAVILAAPPS